MNIIMVFKEGCQLSIVSFMHLIIYIVKALYENKYCIGVFLDLKKAFGVCSFDTLIMKLEKMGVRGTSLEWFKSNLSNRKPFVDVNGNFSSDLDILTCILQGSILGPILFLCYINILFTISRALPLMFAEDTLRLESDNHLPNLINSQNEDINRMAIWFKANKLAVNKSQKSKLFLEPKVKVWEIFHHLLLMKLNHTNHMPLLSSVSDPDSDPGGSGFKSSVCILQLKLSFFKQWKAVPIR
jgi:hypothetical protein